MICFILDILILLKMQKIIAITPIIIPIITFTILLIPNASGIKSKHITAIISPDANDKIKLKNLFDVFLKHIPIIPPKVVPNVPKNNPINVVLNMFSKLLSPYFYSFNIILFYKKNFITIKKDF